MKKFTIKSERYSILAMLFCRLAFGAIRNQSESHQSSIFPKFNYVGEFEIHNRKLLFIRLTLLFLSILHGLFASNRQHNFRFENKF